MPTRERALIYGLLTLLIALNAVTLFGRAPARAAHAGPESGDVPLPLAAVELLGKDSDPNVVLRATKGRLAWGDRPHARAYNTAFVHIGKIMAQLMKSEALEEDRDRLIADLEEREMEYREQLESIGDRLQELDPESDDAKQKYAEGSEIYKQYTEWQQKAMERRGRLDAEHLERAYRELIAAVEVVAARQDVDLVYRFIPTDDAFDAEDPDAAINAIRLRTALLYPSELDLTDEVMEELSLEIE